MKKSIWMALPALTLMAASAVAQEPSGRGRDLWFGLSLKWDGGDPDEFGDDLEEPDLFESDDDLKILENPGFRVDAEDAYFSVRFSAGLRLSDDLEIIGLFALNLRPNGVPGAREISLRFLPETGSDAAVGHEFDLTLRYRVSPRFSVSAGFAVLLESELDEVGGVSTMGWVGFEWRF